MQVTNTELSELIGNLGTSKLHVLKVGCRTKIFGMRKIWKITWGTWCAYLPKRKLAERYFEEKKKVQVLGRYLQESNGNYGVTGPESLHPSLVSVIQGQRSARGSIGMAVMFQTRVHLVQHLFSHKGCTWMSGED